MTSRSDAEVFGFRASEIYEFLDAHGLALNQQARAGIVAENRPKGSGARLTFAEIASARLAEFISYREALKKLREATGDSLKAIASGLKSHDIHEKHQAYLAGPEQAVRRITGADDLKALLDETIDNGGITPAWVGPDDQADPERCGWIRREFVASLRDAVLPCPDTLLNPADDAPPALQEAPNSPEWVRPYIGRREISLGDASEILAGFAPIPTHEVWGEAAWQRINRWQMALIDAVGDAGGPSSEIAGSTWGSNRYSEQMLSHRDIRTWCAKRGHSWPIPEPLGQTYDALGQDARALRRVIDELRENIADRDSSSIAFEERSRRAIDERDTQITALQEGLEVAKAELETAKSQTQNAAHDPGEMDALAEKIRQLEAKLDIATQEIERLFALVPPRPVRLMEIAIAVQRRYWGSTWDVNDRDTWTSQTDIWEWLQQTYSSLSKAQREAIETIACPVDRKK